MDLNVFPSNIYSIFISILPKSRIICYMVDSLFLIQVKYNIPE